VSVAWDVFVASLDPTQLEGERMRVGDLADERPGSRRQRAVMYAHEKRSARFWAEFTPGVYVAPVVESEPSVRRVQKSKKASRKRVEPVFTDAQLEIALAVAERKAA
jgi:hypothetical protein